MSIRCYSILVLVLIGFPILAIGQNPPPQGPPPENPGDEPSTTRSVPAAALSGIVGIDELSDEASSEDLPQIPAMLGGRGSSLAFRSEMERSNYFRGGFNVGAGYDDNASIESDRQIGNTTFSVFPNIAIEQLTSRTRWSLAYGGGFTVNQRLTNRNQGSHDLNFNAEFRLSPHANLRVAEDFSLTAGIFGASAGAAFQPGPVGANTNLLTPLANQRSSATTVEGDYHFALKDMVGASGSFYDLHYSNVTGSGTLVDTRTAGGSAFWLHQIVGRDWAGISYRFQRLTFGPSGETRVHTFTVMNTVNLSKTFTVSAYIGPEHSDNHGVAASGPDVEKVSDFGNWSIAGGVDGGWQQQRTSATVGYSRQVSNGNGVLGAVRLQNVHAALRRELIPGWAATFGVSYGSDDPLTLASFTDATSIKTTSVGGTLERNVGRSLGLQIGYFHDFQKQAGATDPTQNADLNRNRFFVTLSYQWTKPLGR